LATLEWQSTFSFLSSWQSWTPCSAECADLLTNGTIALPSRFQHSFFTNNLDQGFSTFWYPRTPKSRLYPLRTPKSELYALRVPPNKKFNPKGLLLSVFLTFAYPLWPSRVPLGVRVPQVENRWTRLYQIIFKNHQQSNVFRSLIQCKKP